MMTQRKTQAREHLQRILTSISALRQASEESPEFIKWHRDARVAIANTFGETSHQFNEFRTILFRPRSTIVKESEIVSGSFANLPAFQRAYSVGLGKAAAILQSMIDEIEEYWDDTREESPSYELENRTQTNASQIFIIHGRDSGTRETVVRFLENLELQPVVLQEQPNRSRTIIEKFEEYAQVDFAIALFTPDDLGGLEGGNLQHRARQNVIFEFGYFIGKYGRKRTLALVKGDMEIPSDYSGVLYIPMGDSDGWKTSLIRELKTAGFEIDANRLFE